MWNLNDFFWNNGWTQWPQFMWNWQQDPKKQRRKFYLTIFIANIWLNFLYLILWIFKPKYTYELFQKITLIFTDYPPISIFIMIQMFVAFFLVKGIQTWKLQMNKDNLIWVWNNVNLIVFIVLLNATIWTYLSESWTADSLISEINWIWLLFLVISTILLYFWAKRIYDILKELYMSIVHKEEVKDEEDEDIPLGNYDWIKEYYQFNLSEWTWHPVTEHILKQKLPYYRFNFDKILSFLVWPINQTLMIEQSKLISKAVMDTWNKETYVQIDYPTLSWWDELNSLFERTEFSNDYIKINNSFIAFKLRTKYLSNPKHLQTIWDDILPDQRLEQIRQITFSPKKPLKEWSQDYNQMISEFKKPYVLFQNIWIQKMDGAWYVVLNFSKWYRRTVIFPQLDTLTSVLEKENTELFADKPNPLLFFWVKAIWGLLGLTLGRLRHLIFWWESGSWKSVFLNSILYQIIYKTTPNVTKLVLIDPLKVSFQKFKKVKNLAFPVSMTEEEANNAINYLYKMNEDRYTFLESLWYEDIYSYNEDVEKKLIQITDETWLPTKYRLPWNTKFEFQELDVLDEKIIEKKSFGDYKVWQFIPQIVLIYDEFNAYNWSPLYEKNWSVTKLIKLGEQARKAWIILMLWTQKISADSVPSALRENMPTKICLTVWSKANSRAILGEQPENKSDWAFLSWYWDWLIFNKIELDANYAIRSQWFYVSDEEMNDLIKQNFEEFGQNDFIYQEWTLDEYSWLSDFYSVDEVELESWVKLPESLITRNNIEYKRNWIDLSKQLPILIRETNKLFIDQRDKLLDKMNLDEKRKNVKIDTPIFKTEEEMLEEFNRLTYSNSYYMITKSFIRLKLNTAYLSSPEALEKMEDKLNLQLVKLQKQITYVPVKPYKEDSDDYKKMINEYEAAYTLIDNFQIIRDKTTFYIQMNYTPNYKKNVVFPQSKTIRQILTEKLGSKIENLLKWEKFTIT